MAGHALKQEKETSVIAIIIQCFHGYCSAEAHLSVDAEHPPTKHYCPPVHSLSLISSLLSSIPL